MTSRRDRQQTASLDDDNDSIFISSNNEDQSNSRSQSEEDNAIENLRELVNFEEIERNSSDEELDHARRREEVSFESVNRAQVIKKMKERLRLANEETYFYQLQKRLQKVEKNAKRARESQALLLELTQAIFTTQHSLSFRSSLQKSSKLFRYDEKSMRDCQF